MTAIKDFIKKYSVLFYFALTFVISWSGVLLIIVRSGELPGSMEELQRMLPVAIVGMLVGPSVAGILLIAVLSGKQGLRELSSRMSRWRVGARWYAIALLTAPLVFATVLLTLSLFSTSFVPGIVASDDKGAVLLSGLVAGVMVGIFEELGWTGFAIPRLRQRYSVFAAGLIVGVVWGAWHILTNSYWASRFISGEFPQALFVLVNGLGFLVGQLPAYRVLMAWVYDRTGSLLVAMLMHASLTACTLILGPVALSGMALLTYDLALAVVLWGIVTVVTVAHGKQRTQPASRRQSV